MRERLESVLRLKAVLGGLRSFFGGRLNRLEFIARIALYVGLIVLLAWPATTFLQTSSKTVRDLYYLLALLTIAVCIFGMIKAYIERLRDSGLSVWWAPFFLVVPGAAAAWLGQLYSGYRIDDRSFDSAAMMSVIFAFALGAPVMLALWRGSLHADRVEASEAVRPWARQRIEILTAGLALMLVIPTAIYAGLFQDGVWVGGTDEGFSMMDSGRPHKFLKCWNLKGVGAGSGGGSLSGFYRDGYSQQAIDFFRSGDDGFDFAFLGSPDGRSFREQGFQVAAAGISRTDQYDLPPQFMINAAYLDGSPYSVANHTSFAFARRADSPSTYDVVMTVSQVLPENYPLKDFPKARAKVMIGECMRSF